MAILKMKKIREMNEKEIDEKLKELRMELIKDRGTSEVGGTVKNPGKIREIRRTIARIMLIKNQKGDKK
jgi:large subunit ribosomal protein L29